MWEKELIPNPDRLFMRIHDSDIREGNLIPGVFREKGEGELKGMSTDWEAYSTMQESRSRAKDPKVNSIISLIAGNVRSLNLSVDHAPEENNRSHTNIKGINVEVRLKLADQKMFSWEIKTDKVT